MQKNTYFLFPLFILFINCGYEVANNSRMEFTGTIIDEAGNPVPGVPLYLEGVDNPDATYPGNSESKILGFGSSNTSGNFRFVSLKSEQNNLHINLSENSYLLYNENIDPIQIGILDSLFSNVVYVNLPGSLNLETIQLRRRADFHLKINNTTSANDTLFWSISYTHPFCHYVFVNGVISEEKSSCYENYAEFEKNPFYNEFPEDFILFNTQTPEYPNFEKHFSSLLGGVVDFTYHINEGQDQTIQLNIDETQETYVFEY